MLKQLENQLSFDNWRLTASILGVVGSCLLGWRVAGLIKALAVALKIHQQNIKNLADAGGRIGGDVIVFTGASMHVERAQKRGLMVSGFLLVITSAVIQFVLLVTELRNDKLGRVGAGLVNPVSQL